MEYGDFLNSVFTLYFGFIAVDLGTIECNAPNNFKKSLWQDNMQTDMDSLQDLKFSPLF